MSTSDSFSNNSTGRVRQATSQRGSTLVWVMVVVLVMIIALGIGLTAVSGQFNLSSVRHEEHQAYYTALSSTETVAAWITGNADGSGEGEAAVIDQLFERITEADEPGITIDEAGIPEEAGTCTVNLRWLDGWSEDPDDKNHTQLKITSVATFSGVTETVSLTLTRNSSGISTYGEELEASDFSPDDYIERAKELNELESAGVIALYEPDDEENAGFNEGYPQSNHEQLANYINTAENKGLELEARWTNSDLYSTSDGDTHSYHSNVLGTERHGTYADRDWRRFMVPDNGRITIDPLEKDGYEGSSNESRTYPGDANNTRFVGLAIYKTEGKDILFRLASGEAARGTSENVLISTTSSTSKKNGTIISNSYQQKGLFASHWSSARYATIVTLDFTDNVGNNETARYTIDGTEKTYPWHPDKWNKLDLFVQSSGSVSANLVFGPFGHKNDIYLDYTGTGNFMDTYNGQTGRDLTSEWPYVGDDKGLPIFPVDFGKNAHFWILDSPTYKLNKNDTSSYASYVWFMQGVNILGDNTNPDTGTTSTSSIYSTRAVVIGGALVWSSAAHTKDGLNRTLYGFADRTLPTSINYVDATTRFSQLIYNTDIILMPPSNGKTAYSLIRRPDTWQDRSNLPHSGGSKENREKESAKDKSYNPTVTIAGGTIYVGERQSLTIRGSKYRSGDFGNGNNLWVSPDKIVVAAGGALIIEESYYTNIFTDIYVEGGTLTINAGAKIKGNIYAYNGGKVNVEGKFRLDAPSTLEPGQESGLFIYGTDTIGTTFGSGEDAPTITAAGKLGTPSTLPSLEGNSGRVHLVGFLTGDWALLVTGTNTPLSSATFFLCDGYNTTTGRCPHYDGTGNGGGGGGGGETTPTTPGTGDGTTPTTPGTGVSSGGGWTVGTYGDS